MINDKYDFADNVFAAMYEDARAQDEDKHVSDPEGLAGVSTPEPRTDDSSSGVVSGDMPAD